MKTAISNIALPSFDHLKEIYQLHDIGFDGLEVAPSKIWDDVKKVKSNQITRYREQVENAGLRIIGMHSLFWDQPELGLFKNSIIRKKTLDFLIHLSKICRDLGGSFLVFGSPQARIRNGLSLNRADLVTVEFFSELSNHIEKHNTCFIIEALSSTETDYIHSILHSLEIVNKVNRNELQVHLDAKAIAYSSETKIDIFREIKSKLKHVHINDIHLGILTDTGIIDHKLISQLLKDINYNNYISLEQRLIDLNKPLESIRDSYKIIETYYRDE